MNKIQNKTIVLSIAVLSLLLIVSGCASVEKENDTEAETPRICTLDWNPVCGVDGTTYGNKCMAGDVEIAHEGECEEAAEVHLCTAEEKANQICTREYNPVCGSDNQTHATGCTACAAGVDSWTLGEC